MDRDPKQVCCGEVIERALRPGYVQIGVLNVEIWHIGENDDSAHDPTSAERPPVGIVIVFSHFFGISRFREAITRHFTRAVRKFHKSKAQAYQLYTSARNILFASRAAVLQDLWPTAGRPVGWEYGGCCLSFFCAKPPCETRSSTIESCFTDVDDWTRRFEDECALQLKRAASRLTRLCAQHMDLQRAADPLNL